MQHLKRTTVAVLVATAALLLLPASADAMTLPECGLWQAVSERLTMLLEWMNDPADPEMALRNTAGAGGGKWDPNGLTGTEEVAPDVSGTAASETQSVGGDLDQAAESGSGSDSGN